MEEREGMSSVNSSGESLSVMIHLRKVEVVEERATEPRSHEEDELGEADKVESGLDAGFKGSGVPPDFAQRLRRGTGFKGDERMRGISVVARRRCFDGERRSPPNHADRLKTCSAFRPHLELKKGGYD